MSIRSKRKSIPENVIYFRCRQAAFVLPDDLSNEELAFDWTLSKEDKVQIFKRRGDNNRRRYAVQLCTLRKYGRFLENYQSVSTKIIGYLSSQLEIEPIISLPDYRRESTETGYRRDICSYLGYSDLDSKTVLELEKWVTAIISEDYFTETLLHQAEKFLTKKKIVLPSSSQMERLINSVYTKAEQKLLSLIAGTLSNEIKEAIDALLDMDKAKIKLSFLNSVNILRNQKQKK